MPLLSLGRPSQPPVKISGKRRGACRAKQSSREGGRRSSMKLRQALLTQAVHNKSRNRGGLLDKESQAACRSPATCGGAGRSAPA